MAVVTLDADRSALADSVAEPSLVERARAMDAAAWEAIYAAHYDAIYRYAFFRVRQPQAAEDLSAEVFVQAVRAIDRYRHRGIPLRAWLYGIARNVTADYRRRQAARNDSQPLAPDDVATAAATADFAPGVVDAAALDSALRRLGDDQQQVVILRFFEGLSVAEVAAAMSRRENAVKQLQHRALVRLRKLMTEGD